MCVRTVNFDRGSAAAIWDSVKPARSERRMALSIAVSFLRGLAAERR
jgi:hypothetical protein